MSLKGASFSNLCKGKGKDGISRIATDRERETVHTTYFGSKQARTGHALNKLRLSTRRNEIYPSKSEFMRFHEKKKKSEEEIEKKNK